MVAYQVIEIDDVANGLLFYVGQAQKITLRA